MKLAVNGLPGSSATAQWVKTERRSRVGSAAMARAMATASPGCAPTRCMPVSTLRWTRTGRCGVRPAASAAAASPVTPDAVYTVASRSAATSVSISSVDACESTITTASMPASRSSTPSDTSATASTSAPPRRAAPATSTAPWP